MIPFLVYWPTLLSQWAIDCAVGKLAQLEPAQLLLRGLRKYMNPKWVKAYTRYKGIHKDANAVICDASFSSATTNPQVRRLLALEAPRGLNTNPNSRLPIGANLTHSPTSCP